MEKESVCVGGTKIEVKRERRKEVKIRRAMRGRATETG